MLKLCTSWSKGPLPWEGRPVNESTLNHNSLTRNGCVFKRDSYIAERNEVLTVVTAPGHEGDLGPGDTQTFKSHMCLTGHKLHP